MEVTPKTGRIGNWLRWTAMIFVMFSLVLSLATRTFRLKTPHGAIVQSSAHQGMRQHMDRDAAGFVAPVPVFSGFQAPTSYLYVAPAGPPLAVILLEKSLYNRPPPSC
jgi:hypothetical protein